MLLCPFVLKLNDISSVLMFLCPYVLKLKDILLFLCSLPAEGAGGDTNVKLVEEAAVGRVAIYHALLLIVDGVGHINLTVIGVDREPVILRVAALQEWPYRQMQRAHIHAPDVVVHPIYCVAASVEL